MKIVSSTLFILLMITSELWAQRATIQQPVFRNFSANTTVSVPDRGTALLGSISRAGSMRNSYRPGRIGSSYGVFREHAGISIQPTIHDFDAMDRFLLNQGEATSTNRPNGQTSTAYSELTRRYATQSAVRQPTTKLNRAHSSSRNSKTAEFSLKLALKAEKKGKIGLAKLHFQAAERKGSHIASQHLARLRTKPTPSLTARK